MLLKTARCLETNGADFALKGSFAAMGSEMFLQTRGCVEAKWADVAFKGSFVAANQAMTLQIGRCLESIWANVACLKGHSSMCDTRCLFNDVTWLPPVIITFNRCPSLKPMPHFSIFNFNPLAREASIWLTQIYPMLLSWPCPSYAQKCLDGCRLACA